MQKAASVMRKLQTGAQPGQEDERTCHGQMSTAQVLPFVDSLSISCYSNLVT